MRNSPLQLSNFFLGKINIVPSDGPFSMANQITIETTPSFSRNNADYTQWIVRLNVTFKAPPGGTVAYEGSVDGLAHFTITDTSLEEERQRLLIAVNGPSIIYSSIRQVVASLTAQSTNGKMILPSVSFADQRISLPGEIQMPAQEEIDELLREAHNDPNRTIEFQPTNQGLRLYTNSKPISKPETDLAWAFVMEDLVRKGIVIVITPGQKWRLSEIVPA
jgi:preprotein translocase subunit SecB